jgi:hypothetical protein
MKREAVIRRGGSRSLVLGLVAGGVALSCSAGGNNSSLSNGAGATGAGAVGGDNGFIGFGAGGAAGAGAGIGGSNSAVKGPPSIDKCAPGDPGKFGGATAGNRLLYPYDGTIFPRGLGGPLLMWDSPADQILVQAKSSGFTYQDCPVPPDKTRFQIPDDVWTDAGAWSNGTGDPLVITLTVLSGGKVIGPVTVNVLFALATMKGAIYYNTYGSKLAANNGAVLKLVPGAAAATLFLTDTGVAPLGPCRSCHALSADGMTMTANHHFYPGVYNSESYNVTGPTPTLINGTIPEAGFAGIYPDGTRLVTNGPPNPSNSAFFPTAPGDVTALLPGTSKMLEVKTSTVLTPVGWDAPHAQMPMFSPDGKHIVYNDSDKGTGKGHTLFMADYDYASNTFSNQKQIFDDPGVYAAWPFFTPDSKQVIFATDSRADFTSQVPDIFGPPAMTPTGTGHLMVIDLASGTATKLDLANGYKGGQTYLPGGAARDNEREFFPTVSPIAAGGYYWALFTSRRTYGNLWTKDIEDPTTKKIWVTAIGIGAPAGQDPSNPPFYLPGQELTSGNIRAFAALEPCKEDGQACSAGSECCKGICSRINPTTGLGLCGQVPDGPKCSRVDDRCTTNADCCTGADNGVGGKVLKCISTAGSAYCGITIQ